MLTIPIWSDTATAMAIRLCREVYMLTHGNLAIWQPINDVLRRFRLDGSEIRTVVKCAVANGWLETVGNPIFSIRLLDDGHGMFVEENPTLPNSRRRPRS
jgi:hypothetical protein